MAAPMRLLLFSDLHRDRDAARKLVELSQQADVMVGAGDFAVCRKGLADCIDILSESTCPAVLVPGNGESADELSAACANWKLARVLHGNGRKIAGMNFFGIGGGIPVTPLGSWSWDFSEDDAASLLADCPDECVLVSHSPPLGIVDRTSQDEHRGSSSVRRVIDRCRPRLVVCGHIHDSWEQREQIDSTLVINAGPNGVLISL